MKVAVLGCGPAGLMAAHGAVIAGADQVHIFSRKRKSELYGCQYLHAPIPGMTDVAPVEVKYTLVGSTDEYRQKVYGEKWHGDVSPEDYMGNHMAWDIRRTYDNLWDQYGQSVKAVHVTPDWFNAFMRTDGELYDFIISSIPRQLLCKNLRHEFRYQTVWAMGDAPERGMFVEDWMGGLDSNTVVCNGQSAAWYRASKVFGHTSVEFPFHTKEADRGWATTVMKPLDHDCDCWPSVVFVGRYGSWKKDVLSHTAFQMVQNKLVVEMVG